MAVFPAKTGMLHPAKRQAGRQQIIGVDPHIAAFQLGGNPVATRQILRHQSGTKTKIGGIGPADRLGLVGECQHRHHRPKNFLTNNAHIIMAPGQDGRFHEIAILKPLWVNPVSACCQLCALGNADLDIIQNLFQMRRGNQRPHIDIPGHGVANTHRLGLLYHRGDEVCGNAVLDKYACCV